MQYRGRLGLALVVVATVAVLGGMRPAHAQGTLSATPADSLVGQQVIACTYGADLAVTVTGAVWTRVVAGEVAPDNRMWVVALLDVTDLADKTEALTSRPLQLRDADGGIYDVQEDPPDVTEVALVYGVTPPWQEFEPGVTTQSVVTFLLPADVSPLTLVGRRDYCSP